MKWLHVAGLKSSSKWFWQACRNAECPTESRCTMKGFFHHRSSYTMNIQSGGFCICTWLKQSRLSQWTPLKIGAWLFVPPRAAGLFSPLLNFLRRSCCSTPWAMIVLTSYDTSHLRHSCDLLWNTQMWYIQLRLIMFTGFTRKGIATDMINSFQNRNNLLEQTSFESDTHKRINPTTPPQQTKWSFVETQDRH